VNRLLRTFVVCAAIALLCSLSLAQGLKIGYVNSAKILQEFPEAQDAQKKIDAQGKAWQDSLEQMSNDLQRDFEAFQKKQATLNDAAKHDQQTMLAQEEQRGQQFRTEKFGQDGALARLTDSLLTPIKKKIMKVIETVAKSEKLTFVFDRNDQILVLLYGDAKFDYTHVVIDRLTRGQ